MSNLKRFYFFGLFFVCIISVGRGQKLHQNSLGLIRENHKIKLSYIKNILSENAEEYNQDIDTLRKLTKEEQFFIDKTVWVLNKKQIGKTFLVKAPNWIRKNEKIGLEECSNFEITYLGSITIKGIEIKLLCRTFNFGNSCRASSTIRLYCGNNQEIAYYYNMGGGYSDLPLIRGSNLIIRDDDLTNQTSAISFETGIPSIFTLTIK